MKSYRGNDGSERVWYEDTEIEAIMESELRKAKLLPTTDRPAVDIERVVESHLRAHLDQHANLDADVLGMTEFFHGRPPRVSVNRELTGSALDDGESQPGILGRWRATLAHEAAHVLLHRHLYELAEESLSLFDRGAQEPARALHRCLKRDVGYRGGSSDWREVQANKGMAALLMPRTFFGAFVRPAIDRRYPGKGSLSPSEADAIAAELASALQVSKQALRIRLETLGMVAARGQRRL